MTKFRRKLRYIPVLLVPALFLGLWWLAPDRPSSKALTQVNKPIDPSYLTDLPLGAHSYWLQPWRAYLDTPSVTTLKSGLGIQFHIDNKNQAEATARLLAANGFSSVRYEASWVKLDYETASVLDDRILTELAAIKNHNLRPLILLNANDGTPTPMKIVKLTTTAAASAGAKTVELGSASAQLARNNLAKIGFDNLGTNKAGTKPASIAAGVIITSVQGSTATLSKPLPADLPAGSHDGTILKYEPFSPPLLSNGQPNPRFEATMAGWLNYVSVICKEARDKFAGKFDIEVWNELGGNQASFLNIANYYDPSVDGANQNSAKAIRHEILRRTVDWIRNPAHGVPSSVRIGNGFANTTSDIPPSQVPIGLSAIDAHPYPKQLSFPDDKAALHGLAINALGQVDTSGFVPSYGNYYVENALGGVPTNSFIGDISPIITNGYGGNQHGRTIGPPGGTPPQTWVTEVGLQPPPGTISASALDRFKAKMVLRTIVAFIHKGTSLLEISHDTHGEEGSIIDLDFLNAVDSPSDYPGDAAGGQAINAVKHLMDSSQQSVASITTRRSLTLNSLADYGGRKQFDGDGSSAHPSLYDREVTAVLPFQVNDHRFSVAAYVMTRDMYKNYGNGYDLPAETYQIKLAGFNNCPNGINAYDPLNNSIIAVKVVACSSGEVALELPLTDSPRIITIDEVEKIDSSVTTRSGNAQPTDGKYEPTTKPLASAEPDAEAIKAQKEAANNITLFGKRVPRWSRWLLGGIALAGCLIFYLFNYGPFRTLGMKWLHHPAHPHLATPEGHVHPPASKPSEVIHPDHES